MRGVVERTEAGEDRLCGCGGCSSYTVVREGLLTCPVTGACKPASEMSGVMGTEARPHPAGILGPQFIFNLFGGEVFGSRK